MHALLVKRSALDGNRTSIPVLQALHVFQKEMLFPVTQPMLLSRWRHPPQHRFSRENRSLLQEQMVQVVWCFASLR